MRLLRQGLYSGSRVEYGSIQEQALILFEADMINADYIRMLLLYNTYRLSGGKDEGNTLFNAIVSIYRPWDKDLYRRTIENMEKELQDLKSIDLSKTFRADPNIESYMHDGLIEAMTPYNKK